MAALAVATAFCRTGGVVVVVVVVADDVVVIVVADAVERRARNERKLVRVSGIPAKPEVETMKALLDLGRKNTAGMFIAAESKLQFLLAAARCTVHPCF